MNLSSFREYGGASRGGKDLMCDSLRSLDCPDCHQYKILLGRVKLLLLQSAWQDALDELDREGVDARWAQLKEGKGGVL